MSQEQVLKTLANLGFDQVDAQVYVYLAKKGARKASDICKALKLTKQQIYPSLKQLQSKGIVSSTIEHPARFSALPFEKVLDLFINAKMEETRSLQQSKAEILANWQNLKFEDGTSAKFTVIEGRTFIYSKIQQMIQETTRQVLAITTVSGLAQADQRGIFDAIHPSKSKIQFRFLAELSQQNVHVMKALLKETANADLDVEGRNPDMGLTLFPQMLVRDEDEAIFFVKPRTEASIIERDDVCLWTDCKALVKAITAVFEELWRNSTDIREKIAEMETGKLTPRTVIIEDAETAKKKYNEAIQAAKEEILIMTSSAGLVEFCKNLPELNEWIGKGVAVRVMAPIVNEDIEAVKQLSKLCSVKHASPSNLQTTIIDGKHLFQFKIPPPQKQQLDSPPDYKNALYTSNPEYVQKTKTMLNEQWKNASEPSVYNLKSLGTVTHVALFPGAIRGPGPYGKFYPLPPDPAKKNDYVANEFVNEDPLGKLTEQDVVNEIINGQKFPPRDEPFLRKAYASQATAIIHPPDFFKLPPMLIRIHHFEKHSTFGEGDVIMINLWRKAPTGQAYVPVAIVSNNPLGQAVWRKHLEVTPANREVQMAKKDELQIRVHGNTLFAGWTLPINLSPSGGILPPACILFEGYGNVKTEAYSVIQPSGGKFTVKQNGFDAFVTFMHPASKYSGPGTDGFLVRDFVMEMTPEFINGFNPKLETRITEKKNRDENAGG